MNWLNRSTSPRGWQEKRTLLRENCDLRSLAHAVIEAAQNLDERMLTTVNGARQSLAFEPRTLLAMLAFCYARQIYGSTEVIARLRRDVTLCRLCGYQIPDATALGLFRSANRVALRFCLLAALRCLGEQKIAAGLLTKVSEERLLQEATRRITVAAFTDSLELDTQCYGRAA
jgi:hypothetical protein